MNRFSAKHLQLAILAAAAVLAVSSGCAPNSILITPVTARQELKETVLYTESPLPSGKVAVLDLEGIMVNTQKPGLLVKGENPVVLLLEQLEKARRDPAVKAVVLRINSPGGTVMAAELSHTEILRFKESGKPVVVMMMDVAASGGYYAACAADVLVAGRSSVTGSIGVIMQTFELTGTMQKIGIKADAIKSGEQKGGGSPFAAMTPEQREVFQIIVDELYSQFVDVVDQGRPGLSREKVVELADGRVYTAAQALEHGLIDRVGTMRDAIAIAKAGAGMKTAKVVTYARPYGYAPNYYAQSPTNHETRISLLDLQPARLGPPSWTPFLYLWTAP